MTKLPKSVARLTTVGGFIESYQEKLRSEKSCKQAYEAAEEEYRKWFGMSKYPAYETFRNALARWNKNRIKHLKTKK